MDRDGPDNQVGLQLQLIVSQLGVLTQSTNEIRHILTQQGEKLDACLKKVDSLQLETDELCSKVKELDDKMLSVDPADMYNEIKMRIEREKNIIIFGMAENADASKLVRDIMNEVTSPEVLQIKDSFRLGKVKDNKPRPVKVELSDKKDAVTVMKQKHKLSTSFPEIKIKLDKTPKELDEIAVIYKELNERKAKGEKLEVRYVKNKPQIVPNSTKDNNKRARSEGDSPKQHPPKINRTAKAGGTSENPAEEA